MTIMLVELGTLSQYRFLEHGAFYAIFFLSFVMLSKTLGFHIPEVISGLTGAILIGIALFSSIKFNKNNPSVDLETS